MRVADAKDDLLAAETVQLAPNAGAKVAQDGGKGLLAGGKHLDGLNWFEYVDGVWEFSRLNGLNRFNRFSGGDRCRGGARTPHRVDAHAGNAELREVFQVAG
jgi:hypothetical protein